jgi:Ca2+-binding RTX toxin-like protein
MHFPGWTESNSGANADVAIVSGPATPPAGSGSAQFSVGADGDQAAQLRNSSFNGTELEFLSDLSYSTYVSQDGSGGQAVYIILEVDLDGNGTTDDLLFFEPAYQSAVYFPSNPQATLVTNTWQTWDALNGGWWSLNGIAGATPGAGVKSLADYVAAEPDAALANTALGSIRLVAGFGAGAWDNFIGSADAFAIGVAGVVPTVYDFNPHNPINDTINGGNGNDVISGDQAAPGSNDTISGFNGNDQLSGLGGDDTLKGGNGNDTLNGGSGDDSLYGENGNDTLNGGADDDYLEGGNGNDTLTGGAGEDVFGFGKGDGADTATDFDTDDDLIDLHDGLFLKSVKLVNVDGGALDTVLQFSNGSMTLLNTGNLGGVSFWDDYII